MKKTKLIIEGMHCSSCALNIEKSLRKIKGVKEASANVMLKKAIVESDDSVSEDEMKKAVSQVGYKAISAEKI